MGALFRHSPANRRGNPVWMPAFAGMTILVGLFMNDVDARAFVPEDGFHPGSKMEMWNLHGHLFTEDGNEIGLSAMFFTGKYLIVSGTAVGLGLSDTRGKISRFNYDFFLPLFGKVSHASNSLDEKFGPNRLQRIGPDQVEMAMRTGPLGAVLRLRMSGVAMPYAGTGFVGWETHRSWGYTYPRAEVSGTVEIDGRPQKVGGHVNFDHAWSNSMEEDHDMFMIQMDDGVDANVLFRHDRKGTGPLPGSFVTVSYPDGRQSAYSSYAVRIVDSWKSPRSGRVYPRRVQIELPEDGMEWVLIPAFDDQEFSMMMGMMAFWTGTGSVRSTGADPPIRGRYCGMMQGYGKD